MAALNNGVLDGIRRVGAKIRDITIDGGLPGAPLGYRIRGATQSGPPASGTWKAGDEVHDRNGVIWICTTAGTPGQWTGSLTFIPPSGDTTGATDTALIQAAINSANHNCLLTNGSYYVTGLTATSYCTIAGMGAGLTIINVTGTAATGIAGTDLRNVTIRDLSLTGPGSGTGKGIAFELSANASLPYINIARVYVSSFGSNGVDMQSPQCSTYDNVISSLNGGHGFDFHSTTATTSTTFSSCYAIQNTGYGYYMQSVVYSSMVACAADKNQLGGYYWLDPQGVNMSGCGCEALTGVGLTVNGTGGGGGYGFKASAMWLYNNNSYAIHVTGGAEGISLDCCVENTPATSTIAAASNGGEISQVATWSSPSAGVLAIANAAYFNPTGGTFTVATSTTTATCTYTGVSGNTLTGVAYVSGSAAGTVSTGGAVSAAVNFILADSGTSVVVINPQNLSPNSYLGNYVLMDQSAQLSNSGPGGCYLGQTYWYTTSPDIATPGQGLKVAEGSNAKQGTATLAAGTKVVSNTSVTANSRIMLTTNTPGGTPGWLQVSARTPGTSFTILSSSNTDTSVVAYEIFEPG